MAKTVKVYVIASEGRYIPGLGNREAGQFYELAADQAQALIGYDKGLALDNPNAPKKAVKDQAVEPEKE